MDCIFVAAAPDDFSATGRRGGLAPWQVKRILKHIANNIEATTRVADLAAVARLSTSHFAHAFRMSFNTSPAALIRRWRLERAREMLLNSQWSLAEIALACGFADQAHMSRLFRRHLDLPPARWREWAQNEGRATPRIVHGMYALSTPVATSSPRLS